MARKRNNKRRGIKLRSKLSSHYYVTEKNFMNTPDKMKANKYDPIVRKVCEYVEEKL